MIRKLIAVLALSLPCSAQIALVAHNSAQSGSNAATTTGINTTGANFILVCAAQGLGYAPPNNGVTDSRTNTWLQGPTESIPGGYGYITPYYAFGASVGSGHTFTYTGQGSASVALSVMAFSGVASGPDQQSKNYGDNTPVASGSITPTNANELVTSCFSAPGNTPIGGTTVGSPMTLLDHIDTSGSNIPPIYDAYQIQTTATAVNPTWNNTSGGYNGGQTVSDTFYSTLSPATLTITTTALAEAFHSVAYSASNTPYPICLAGLGGVQPYTWTVTSGNLPPGLSLSSSTGCISGTPTTTASAVNVVFKVTDAQPVNTSVTLPMTVATSVPSLGLGTCPNPITGTQYQAITPCTVAGSGGTAPLTYTQDTSGTDYQTSAYMALPAGVTIGSSSGTISGTNYAAGESSQGSFPGPANLVLTDSLGSYTHLTTLNFVLNADYSWLVAANACGSVFPCDSIFSSQVRLDSLPADTAPYANFPTASQGWSISINPWEVFIKIPNSQSTVAVTTQYGGYQVMFPPYSLTANGGFGGNPTTSYGPIPTYLAIEGNPPAAACTGLGGNADCHGLGVQLNSDGVTINSIWTQYGASYVGGNWLDGSNTAWTNAEYIAETMPAQDTGTTDAAGLPVVAELLTYDQLMAGDAGLIRFTYPQNLSGYVWPGTAHSGGIGGCSGGYHDVNGLLLQSDPPTSCSFGFPPFGSIWRIKASTYASPPNACLTNATTNPQASRIFTALRQHGLIDADNGGFYPTIAADARWNSADLACISNLHISDLEMVNVSSIIKDTTGSPPIPTVSYKTTATLPTSGVSMSGSVVLGGNVVIQ